jgi:hypothetical protein
VLWDTSSDSIEKSLVGSTSDSVLTTFTLTEGVNGDRDYHFRVRSKNLYGWGPYSLITKINPDKRDLKCSTRKWKELKIKSSITVKYGERYNIDIPTVLEDDQKTGSSFSD